MSKFSFLIKLLVMFFSLSSLGFANEVVLKSGQKIEGKITERTDKYIKIDPGFNVAIMYYEEEIDTVDGKKFQTVSVLGVPPVAEVKAIEVSTPEADQPSDDVAIAREYYAKGHEAYGSRNWPEAIIYFEKAFKLNPHNSEPLYWMHQACGVLAGENVTESIKCYEKEAELDPKNAFDYFRNVAFIYSMHLKQYDRAAEFYKKAIELYPDGGDAKAQADIYMALGHQYGLLGQDNQEIESYEKAKDVCKKAGLEEREREIKVAIVGARGNQGIKNEAKKSGQYHLKEQQTKDSFHILIFAYLLLFALIGVLLFVGWKRRSTAGIVLKKDSLNIPKGLTYVSWGLLFFWICGVKADHLPGLFIKFVLLVPFIWVSVSLLQLRKWAWYASLILSSLLFALFMYYMFILSKSICSLSSIRDDSGITSQMNLVLILVTVFFAFLPAAFYCFSFFYLLRPKIKNLFK